MDFLCAVEVEDMCRLTTCCGCCSLEAGVILQGCLDCTFGSTLVVTATCLWSFAIMYPDLVEKQFYGEDSDKERTHVLIIVFMVAFTLHSVLLLIRAGVLLGAVFTKSSPLVMTGIVLSVVEIVLYLCLSICLFIFFNPVFGALAVLYVLITVHCLTLLVGYFLQLRSGLPDAMYHTGVAYSVPDYTTRHQAPGGIHVESSTPTRQSEYARGGNNALNLASTSVGPRPVKVGEPSSTATRQPMGSSQVPGTPLTAGEPPGYSISPSWKSETFLTIETPPSRDIGSTFTNKKPPGFTMGFHRTSLPTQKPPGYPMGPYRNTGTSFTNKDTSRLYHGSI